MIATCVKSDGQQRRRRASSVPPRAAPDHRYMSTVNTRPLTHFRAGPARRHRTGLDRCRLGQLTRPLRTGGPPLETPSDHHRQHHHDHRTDRQLCSILGTDQYPIGVKCTMNDIDALPITRPGVHGEWNDTVRSTARPYPPTPFGARPTRWASPIRTGHAACSVRSGLSGSWRCAGWVPQGRVQLKWFAGLGLSVKYQRGVHHCSSGMGYYRRYLLHRQRSSGHLLTA